MVIRSLTEVFDAPTALGTLMFQLLGLFAEFERNLPIERTTDGLATAKANGSQVGRKNALTDQGAAKMCK